MRPAFVLEVGPLGERHHTGIANVTKQLARQMLRDGTIEARFVLNRTEIQREIIERIVDLEGGDILWWLGGRAGTASSFSAGDTPLFGLFPALKWQRRLFPFEIQILHDLTPILTPEFHSAEAISYWSARLPLDLASTDLIVAVSESTRADLRTYFPELSNIPCIVAPLAPSESSERGESLKAPLLLEPPPGGFTSLGLKPFVAVLGTLEPRKNARFVLEYIASRPDILKEMQFVFVGREGWGVANAELIKNLDLSGAMERGDIRFTGFVPDAFRDRLVAEALCVVYPSLYEGFGLPILEALHFGTPVITGRSTSLPEAGGDQAIYCDLTSAVEFEAALNQCLAERKKQVATGSAPEAEARRKWASAFTWQATYERIRDAALEQLAAG